MSTTARKARKRAQHEHGVPVLFKFQHPRKTGTPVPNRQENQPFVHEHGGTHKMVNASSTAAKRRLAEYEARTSAATHGRTWPDHRRASRA